MAPNIPSAETGGSVIPLSDSQKELLAGLTKPGQKVMPFCYLYDDVGSDLYEDITKLEEYYPYRAEGTLLKANAAEIVASIPPGTLVVELGCGTARKTPLLLAPLAARDGRCSFAGIDVSASFLKEAQVNLLASVPGARPRDLEFVEAEYMEGLRQVRARHPDRHLAVLWLGSSVGNLKRAEAVAFMREALEATGPNMRFLLCADMWKDMDVLYAAYHDSKGVTEAFIKNGVRAAMASLGHLVSDETVAGWGYETVVNPVLRQVEMYVRFPNGLDVGPGLAHLKPGESILMEVSRKFTLEDIAELAAGARLCIAASWRTREYGGQLLVPAGAALEATWDATNAFFAQLPDWLERPIDVRHPFCFYYGHVNAFAKLKLFPHEPASPLDTMFSRGIDPIVLDPSQCHSHPEVPAEWPPRAEIEEYVREVRERVREAVVSGAAPMRQVLMALEHEHMHIETLCYMLAQKRKADFVAAKATLPPSSRSKRQSQTFSSSPVDLVIPAGSAVLGVPVPTPSEGLAFLWDNEGPPQPPVSVAAFALASTPVTVGEFVEFVEGGGYERRELWEAEDLEYFEKAGHRFPATWSESDDGFVVHGPFASHNWRDVADSPVFVSMSEAQAYARSKDSRLMTEPEYQRVLDTGAPAQAIRTGGWEWTSTLFTPFEGFSPLPEYPEYSTDFFDGRHFVLKGASPVTPAAIRRDSFRNYFQRQYPYVFAKFRLCRDSAPGEGEGMDKRMRADGA